MGKEGAGAQMSEQMIWSEGLQPSLLWAGQRILHEHLQCVGRAVGADRHATSPGGCREKGTPGMGMAMGNRAELAPGGQRGLCWELWVWGTRGLRWPCPLPSHGASPRAAVPRSPLSALGPPVCREQAVSAGGSLRLQPEKPPQQWVKVEWRVTLDGGSQWRILMAEKNKADLPSSKNPFSGRAVFQQDTLSLRISPVGVADSGVYRADFENASGHVTNLCFRVSVWEPVHQPRLEARVLHREQSWCNLSLVCTVPSAGNVSYTWSCTGDPLGALERQPRLHLQVHGDAGPTVCRCNVSNPVSWSMASTDALAACRVASSGLPNVIPWWAVAVSLVLALATAVAIVVTCHWWRKRRKVPSEGHADQMLTVYEEVGKARTSQNSNGTSGGTTEGNTIYAVISNKTQGPGRPQQPESCTIYSTVQPTRRSPSLRRKRLDPALVSTAYVEATGGSRRWCPPLQTSPPAPAGHHFS
ncbi:natural killer cell receptor 2B4-like isoform 2-T2 [Theristicus caerulescens]